LGSTAEAAQIDAAGLDRADAEVIGERARMAWFDAR
jgi:hypothetical protein